MQASKNQTCESDRIGSDRVRIDPDRSRIDPFFRIDPKFRIDPGSIFFWIDPEFGSIRIDPFWIGLIRFGLNSSN